MCFMNTSIHLPNSRFGNPTCERAGRSGKNMPANSARAFVQVCAAFMLGAAPLSASTWVGGEAGKWGDAVKWSGGVPGGNSDVLIQGLANVVVGEATSDDMLTIQKLDLVPDGGVSPRLRISGLGNRPFLASDTFTMDGNAVLEVDGSTLRIDGLMGGHLNFLAGEMLLRVGRIQTTRGATFRVGRTGNGHLSMLSGELVAEGDLIVGGLGGSSGLLELHSGVVAVTGLLQVADDIGSEGLVRIHGGEIVATNITVRIGDDGRGSLEMRGGSARFGDVSVGRDLTGEGQLSVVGGRLEAGDISLGRLSGSRGIATFAGGEVLLPLDNLYIGREGHGVLCLEGGTLHASNVVVAAGQSASGVLEMHSGVLRTSHLNVASANATFRWEGGRIETAATATDGRPLVVGNGRSPAVLLLVGGEHVFPGGLVVSSNAVLEGDGKVLGRVTVLPGGSNRLESPGPAPGAPRLSISLSDGFPSVSLTTVVGLGYLVETRSNGTPGWSAVGRVAGTGGLVTVVDSEGRQPFRIYRARVE
jgi:hypothetical protein